MRVLRVEQKNVVAYQAQPQPLPGVERADLRQKVWATAARMPASARRLLLRRELEGLSYAQIGAVMGISTERVRRRLHRARALFRKKYAGYMAVREKRIKCRRLGDLLSGYHDDELRGMQRRRVADHLALCGDCQRGEERLASTSELLATLAPSPAPPGLADRLFTSRIRAVALPGAGSDGTIWRLAAMLLVAGGFIAGVAYLAAKAWDDGGGSSGAAMANPSTPTPTATPPVDPTRAPTAFAVLTPAAVPGHQDTSTVTVTVTATPERKATPVPQPTTAPSPTADVTNEPPPPSPTPPPPTPSPPTPVHTPTREPTPSPTPTPLPGGIRGVATCEGEAVSGAQISIAGPYPGGGSAWGGTTGADGSFSSGLGLAAGSYVVSISWQDGNFDSALASVPAGGYADVAAECTIIINRGHW